MAGFDVDKQKVNTEAAAAARDLRNVLDRIERLKVWLDDHPGYDATSDLVELGFTEDEAYLLHSVFTGLDSIRTTHSDALSLARKLTGLE